MNKIPIEKEKVDELIKEAKEHLSRMDKDEANVDMIMITFKNNVYEENVHLRVTKDQNNEM